MKFKSLFQRRSNSRTTESPSKKDAKKKGENDHESAERKEESAKTPDAPEKGQVIVSGCCKNCGENTYIGVSRTTVINSCFTGQDLLNVRLELKDEGGHEKENVRGMSENHKGMIMRSPQDKFPELLNTKDESDLEYYDEVIELQEKLLALESTFAEKQSEWLQLEKDYLLCIRAAERGRVEAVEKLTEAEKNYKALLAQFQSSQMTIYNSNLDTPILVKEDSKETFPVSASTATPKQEGGCDKLKVRALSFELGRTETIKNYYELVSQPDLNLPESLVDELGTPESGNVSVADAIVTSGESVGEKSMDKIGDGGDASPTGEPEMSSGRETDQSVSWSESLESPKTEKGSADTSKRTLAFVSSKIIDSLRKAGNGSLRNALLKWCQLQTTGYNVDITNFSSSWTSGLAAAALLHSLSPGAFQFEEVRADSPTKLFKLAVDVAGGLGVPHHLNVEKILSADPPPWDQILDFVKEIYVTVNHAGPEASD